MLSTLECCSKHPPHACDAIVHAIQDSDVALPFVLDLFSVAGRGWHNEEAVFWRSASTRSPGCGTIGAAYTTFSAPATIEPCQRQRKWPVGPPSLATLRQEYPVEATASIPRSALYLPLPAWMSCVQAEPAKARFNSAGPGTDRGKHRGLWHGMSRCRQLTGDQIPASQEVHQGIRVNLQKTAVRQRMAARN